MSSDLTGGKRDLRKLGCRTLAVLTLGLVVAGFIACFHSLALGLALLGVAIICGFVGLDLSVKIERAEQAIVIARYREIAAPSGNAWRALLAAEGLQTIIDALALRVRPALRLELQPASEFIPGQSRIGGLPDLPAGMEWPRHQGLPLSFLAQIDLAAAARVLPSSPLPAAGWLAFFYVADQSVWGFDPASAGSSRVIYIAPANEVQRAPAPADLPEVAVFKGCALEFVAYEDLPDLEDDNPIPEGDEAAFERYLDVRKYLTSAGGSSSHKLLGHAEPVQSPMELECELVTNGIYCGDPSGYKDPRAAELAKNVHQWRLLFQLDSDDRTDMMWGDLGKLYFWIRESDLQERCFERAWMILQCH